VKYKVILILNPQKVQSIYPLLENVLAFPMRTIILVRRSVVDKEAGDNAEYFIASRVLAVTRTSQA
jgi:hypothetical protein